LEQVEVAAQRHKIGLQLSCNILPNAPRTDAVACAVVAMPILIFQNFIQVVLIICPQAKSAKFAVAFIVYVFLLFTVLIGMVWIKLRKKVRKKCS